MERRCAWCGKLLGYKPGDGVSHGICDECLERLLEEGGDNGDGEDESGGTGCPAGHIASR